METIIVISVLCVILVTLYGAYSKLLINVQKKSLYDNTEYIYKTSVIRKYLEENALDLDLDFTNLNSNEVYVVCSNKQTACNKKEKLSELFEFMKVQGVYITTWQPKMMKSYMEMNMEPTTIRYIKSLDPAVLEKKEDVLRIIVMFEEENNNEENNNIYQYASLRIGSRG